MTEQIERLLDTALDIGMSELQFWELTPGEVGRAVESWNRRTLREAKEKASYDYILAALIGKHVGRILGDKGAMPTIEEVYSNIFSNPQEAEEVAQTREAQKVNLSALRFKQFAQSYNSKFNKEVPKDTQ